MRKAVTRSAWGDACGAAGAAASHWVSARGGDLARSRPAADIARRVTGQRSAMCWGRAEERGEERKSQAPERKSQPLSAALRVFLRGFVLVCLGASFIFYIVPGIRG